MVAGFQLVSVAIVFALCGALSASYLLPNFPSSWNIPFPLPFGALCTGLFMRNAKAFLAVPLMGLVWLSSSFCAFCVGMSPLHHDLPPGCVGGLVGGAGLTLCVAICYRHLFSPNHFLIGAAVGGVAGLSFIPWTLAYGSNLRNGAGHAPIVAFVIWEAAMGSYLYFLCSRAASKSGDPDSDALTVNPIEPSQQ